MVRWRDQLHEIRFYSKMEKSRQEERSQLILGFSNRMEKVGGCDPFGGSTSLDLKLDLGDHTKAGCSEGWETPLRFNLHLLLTILFS